MRFGKSGLEETLLELDKDRSNAGADAVVGWDFKAAWITSLGLGGGADARGGNLLKVEERYSRVCNSFSIGPELRGIVDEVVILGFRMLDATLFSLLRFDIKLNEGLVGELDSGR